MTGQATRRPPRPAVDADRRPFAPPNLRAERRTSVCIVAPSLDILGGQAVVAQRLLSKLATESQLQVAFLPHNPRLPGVLRYLQRVKYVRTLSTSVAYVALLLRELRKHDIVHVFSAAYWSFILAPAPAILIGRWFGKRVILNYRSGTAHDHLTRWPRSTSAVLRRVDQIIVPSNYLVDVFGQFGYRATPVCNFVNVDAIAYRARRALSPVFLSNRNFAPLYNVGCVLRAFALIQASVPTARLIVAGDGEEREMLHRLAEELQLKNVEFLGAVPPERMPGLYDQADVYLNAPNIDNMPNSVVEAFAAGLPVVTSRAGGIPYIVTHEETGLLVDCNDHEAMANSALRLLRNSDLAIELAGRAREEVLAKYTWEAVRRGWLRAYGVEDSVA